MGCKRLAAKLLSRGDLGAPQEHRPKLPCQSTAAPNAQRLCASDGVRLLNPALGLHNVVLGSAVRF
eukprot:15166072-Alexandrium_andersonii.AAC.1